MNQNFGDRWPDVATEADIVPGPSRAMPVIALHCSGADGGQWRSLRNALGTQFNVLAPNLIGSGDAGSWNGGHAFALMDEAKAVIDLVDRLADPAHLIGHSYGGGVALKVAAERPARVASLALYEPSAFHILRQVGPGARNDRAEIERLAEAIGAGVVSGAYQQAAEIFVDYWNGTGSWASLRPSVRQALITWLPKAPLDFRALIEDETPLESYARITCPVLLLRGADALSPSRRIVDVLLRNFPNARLNVVAEAGHMGPLTNATSVNAHIAAHLRSVSAGVTQSHGTEAKAA